MATVTVEETDKELTKQLSLLKQRNKALANIVDVEKDIVIKSREIQTAAGAVKQQYESVRESVFSGIESFTTGMFGGPIGGLINTLTIGTLKRRKENAKAEADKQKEKDKKTAAEEALHEEGLKATAEILKGTEQYKRMSVERITDVLRRREVEAETLEAEEQIKEQQKKALELIKRKNQRSAEANGGTSDNGDEDTGAQRNGGTADGNDGIITAIGEQDQLLIAGFGLNSPPFLETLTKSITGQAETKREEEREEDREHKELIDTLKGIQGVEKKEKEEDGGWLPGIATLASIVGGVAMGLATEGAMFKFTHLNSAIDNFKTKWLGFGDDTAKIVSKTTVAVETAGDVTKSSRIAAKVKNFLGPTMTGMFDNVAGRIDDVAKGAKVAAAEGGMLKGLGKAFGKTALKLTSGVALRALSIAGNPVFDLIATGKDVFDIAHAVTDDDVATAVKKEDVGAVIGSIVGGALGFALGGPAGAALGIGLGNMAGEFIGSAMDDPEILGAIETVRKGLTDEKALLKTEIAAIQTEMDALDPNSALYGILNEQLAAQKLRQKEVDEELKAMEGLKKGEEELKAIKAKGDALAAKKHKLEADIEAAEDKGDSARVAYLTKLLENTEEQFETAEDEYAAKTEELKAAAQKTTGALAEASTNFFDKIATEGGFFGGLFSMFGATSLKGDAKQKYIEEQIKQVEGKIKEQQALLDTGDEFDWALEPRVAIIAKLEKEKSHLSEQITAARGAIIVNRPSYLPSSGVVVGEHASWSGRGAARGGIPDGGPEAIVPLGSDRAGAFFDPIAQRMGETLNAQMYARIGGERAGASESPTLIDNTTIQNVTNNTVVRSPSPRGQEMHFERGDFVHKIA